MFCWMGRQGSVHATSRCDLSNRNSHSLVDTLIYGRYYSELLRFGCQKATRQTLIKAPSFPVQLVLLQGFIFPSESYNLMPLHNNQPGIEDSEIMFLV